MFILLREHRYSVLIGSGTHLLRIEELVAGPTVWNGKFRLQLAADRLNAAETIYGSTADEVAKKGAAAVSRR